MIPWYETFVRIFFKYLITLFNKFQFGAIRTVEEKGKVLFCGSDVVKALEYNQPHKAVEHHCKYGMKRIVPHPQSKTKIIEIIFITKGDSN